MTDTIGGNARQFLRNYVSRIESVNQDIDELKDEVKSVYEEAKSHGFDVKILRKVITLRKKDRDALDEERALVDLYMDTLDKGESGDE